ncbi:MAG: sodium:proton antiporter [Alphaproteobacteria bacterium]|nr:sodium:proton antiporter [Alphaproteobacteria bacterium]
MLKYSILFALTLFSSLTVNASGLDGTTLSFWWAVPFGGILLSLALMPIIAGHFWHNHFGKIAAGWSLITLGMISYQFGLKEAFHEVLLTYFHEFIPFIIFILSLYVICGGIKIDITTKPNPYFNTTFLAITTFVSSWIGTTGAAMLFIRPFLHVNENRPNKRHLVIFFIFLVCNIGGSLTAVGDPPLFLGFLNGIDFFWPTTHLFGPFLTVSIPLLVIFYFFDKRAFKKEGLHNNAFNHEDEDANDPFIVRFGGRRNLLLLLCTIAVIILSGILKSKEGFYIGGVFLSYPNVARDLTLLLLTYISLQYGNKRVRSENHFTWAPFMEVFKVFAAIFITAAPVIAILKAGEQGAFVGLVKLVNTGDGFHNDLYYWFTGGLSAFLDNAPTYLVFFNLAGGNPTDLMGPLSHTLIAISCGSVFMGALTYIGNAPNFMVKAIAEQNNIAMPSFFGYMVWSILILIPLFILADLVWI